MTTRNRTGRAHAVSILRSAGGLGAMVAALVGAAVLAGPARAQAPAPQPGTIVVTGEGEVTAAPDVADISIGVTTDGDTASAALQANAKAVAAVLDTLRKGGVEGRDLQTTGLSLETRYEPQKNGSPKAAGYRASNMVSVHVRNLGKLGDLLDQTVSAGANQIRGIVFGLSDRSGFEDEARRRAMQDAARRAAVYAQAGGVKLGALRSVEEEGHPFPQPRMMAAPRMAMAEAPVPVEGGELSLRATVRVTYALGD